MINYLVHSCWGLHLDSRFQQTRGFGSTRGFPKVLLSRLWLALLCYGLCLLDTFIELHATDGKMFNDFPIGKVKVTSMCSKGLFNI